MQFQKNRPYDHIIYHGGCNDGIASAWVIWESFPYSRDTMIFHGVQDRNYLKTMIPEQMRNKNIIILDFSFDVEGINYLCDLCQNVTILDHHQSAYDLLKNIKRNNLYMYFDMNLSAAQITYDHFFPNQRRPQIIDYIADRDLWKWKLPNSKEINKALWMDEYITFENLSHIYQLYINNKNPFTQIEESKFMNNLAMHGTAYLVSEKKILSQLLSQVQIVQWDGFTIGIACGTILRSELGNECMEKFDIDFAVIWRYILDKNQYWISLRSSKNKGLSDLIPIAKNFGGGGHPNACGFTWNDTLPNLLKTKIKNLIIKN